MARQLIEYIIKTSSESELDTLIPDLEAWNIQIVHRYGYLSEPTICVLMTGLLAKWLQDDSRITSIEQSIEFHVGEKQENARPHLDRLDQRNLPLSGAFTFSSDGTGVIAYVLDSGCRFDHVQFNGRVSPVGKVGDPSTPFDPFHDSLEAKQLAGTITTDELVRLQEPRGIDELGHGTHVAGIIGSQIFGVAKNVTLKTAKIFDRSGITSTGTILAGIDAIVADFVLSGADAAVCNMSFGAGISPTSPPITLEIEIAAMVTSGITVVVAAGNKGSNANSTTPARMPEVITVGAVDGNDTIANFSNFGDPESIVEPGFEFQEFEGSNTGSSVDIFASGTQVLSTWHTSLTAVNSLSGTSMASPAVSGVAALILENSPSATPASVATDIDSNSTTGVITFGPGVLPSTPNKLIYSIFVDHEIEWITSPKLLGDFPEGTPWSIPLVAEGFSGNAITYSILLPNPPTVNPGHVFGFPIGAVLNGVTGLISSPGSNNGSSPSQDVVFEFTIRASDGLVFADRTSSIKISEFDLPPKWVTVPNLGQIEEGEPVSIQLNAVSQNGAPVVTYASIGDLPHEWILSPQGFISGTAPLLVNRDLDTSFAVKASDGIVFADQTFSLVIKQRLDFLGSGEPEWKTPTGNIATVFPGEPFSFFLEASDTDNTPQPLKFVFEFESGDGSQFGPSGAFPPGLNLNEDTGEISGFYTGGVDADFEFAIFIHDGANIVSRSFTITGKSEPNNFPPVWITSVGNIGSVDTFEEFNFQLEAVDFDSQPNPLSYSVISGSLPNGINLNPTTGIISGFGPFVTDDVHHTFTVRVSDGQDHVDRTFSLIVIAINFGPEWQTLELKQEIPSINEGEDFAFPLVATDPNADDLTYSIVAGALPPIVSLNPTNGVLSGPIHNVDADTDFTFTVRADDSISNPIGEGIFVDREFTITVLNEPLNTNAPPVWSTSAGLLVPQAFEGEQYQTLLQAFDPDDNPDPITFVIASGSLPSGLTLNQNTGVISGIPNIDTDIVDEIFEFTVFAFDGVDFASRDFSIEVIDLGDLNQPPEWSTPSGLLGSFDESVPLSIVLSAFDPDGDDLIFNITAGILPPGLNIDTNTGVIIGTPDSIISTTTFNFAVKAEDPSGAFTVRVFAIEILDTVNLVPEWITIAGLLAEIEEGLPTLIALTAFDPDSGPLSLTFSLTLGGLPPGLSLNTSTGVIDGTPDPVTLDTNFVFEISVSDGLASAPREFSITIIDSTVFVGTKSKLSVPILGELRQEWRLWNTDSLIPDVDLFQSLNPDFGRVSPIEPTDFRKEPKIFVANNLNTGDPTVIFNLFESHHSDFNIFLSAPDFAVVRNLSTGDVIYEVIYMRVVDPQEGSAFNIPDPQFVSKNFSHLRKEILDNIGNDDQLPDWMIAEQVFGNPESVIGYIPAAVMAFVQPGKGTEIIERLNEITQTLIEIQSTPTTFDADTTTFDLNTTTFDDFNTTITIVNKGTGHQFVGREFKVDRYLFENTIDDVRFLKFIADTPNPIWVTPPGLLGTFTFGVPIPFLQLQTESPIGLSITYTKIFGNFPQGIDLNNSTGEFFGTPTNLLLNGWVLPAVPNVDPFNAEFRSFIIKAEDENGNSSIRRFEINTIP